MKNDDSSASARPSDPEAHPQVPEAAPGYAKATPSGVPRVDLALNVGDLVKIASPRGMDTRLFRIHKKTKKGFEVRPVALLGWKTEKQ